jgi:hypothetical protein
MAATATAMIAAPAKTSPVPAKTPRETAIPSPRVEN